MVWFGVDAGRNGNVAARTRLRQHTRRGGLGRRLANVVVYRQDYGLGLPVKSLNGDEEIRMLFHFNHPVSSIKVTIKIETNSERDLYCAAASMVTRPLLNRIDGSAAISPISPPHRSGRASQTTDTVSPAPYPVLLQQDKPPHTNRSHAERGQPS